MTDDTHLDYSGGEVRLGSGQLAQLSPGGTVRVVQREPYHQLSVAHRRDPATPVLHAHSATYEALIDFLKQLEVLDYQLLDLRRVTSEE
jgi:hypothetical protein